MEILHRVVTLLTDNWQLIAILLAPLGLSGLQQKIKKWFKLESPRVQIIITTTLSLANAVIPALLGWYSANPEALGVVGGISFYLMTLSYRFLVKPLSKEVNEAAEEQRSEVVAALSPIEQQDLVTAVPAGTLGTVPQFQNEQKADAFEL